MMVRELDKRVCACCGWKGLSMELEPTATPGAYVCPLCQGDDVRRICDEPGCDDEALAGVPVEEGVYRHTCGRHMPPLLPRR